MTLHYRFYSVLLFSPFLSSLPLCDPCSFSCSVLLSNLESLFTPPSLSIPDLYSLTLYFLFHSAFLSIPVTITSPTLISFLPHYFCDEVVRSVHLSLLFSFPSCTNKKSEFTSWINSFLRAIIRKSLSISSWPNDPCSTVIVLSY